MHTAVLIHPDKIRNSIKRLFDGKVSTMLGELFQNSQRAGATNVTIETNSEGFTYTDNGTGLKGIEGFHTLLCLGDSHFDNPNVEPDQAPMGLGLHSILASDQITEIVIQSGGYELSLNPKRWWDEKSYYTSWSDRLTSCPTQTGFHLKVKCHQKLIDSLKLALPQTAQVKLLGYNWATRLQGFPAWGYSDLLEITIDDQPVYTGLPLEVTQNLVLTELEWKGCPVKIYAACDYNNQNIQLVNWYGQLIPVSDTFIPFGFLVTVRVGSPVNPKAPTREGLINDGAKEALMAAIKEAIFTQLCRNDTTVATLRNIKALYRMDNTRASQDCPYFVAAQYESYQSGDSSETDNVSDEQVCRYDNQPMLIDSTVKVVEDDRQCVCSYGISSFISLITQQLEQTLQKLLVGNPARLKEHQLWWKPGVTRQDANSLISADWFRERGQWTLFPKEQSLSQVEQWHPVSADVFAFNTISSWDIGEVDWVIGTADPIAAMENFSQAAFDPNDDDHDFDVIQEAYEASTQGIIRQLMGDAVAPTFSYWELSSYAARKTGVPQSVITIFEIKFQHNSDQRPERIILIGQTPLEPFELTARIY